MWIQDICEQEKESIPHSLSFKEIGKTLHQALEQYHTLVIIKNLQH